MAHLRQKVAFGLVCLVCGCLFQLQDTGLIGLLLLLGPHLLNAAGVFFLVLLAQQIEKRDQNKDHCADQHIDDHLLPHLRRQLIASDDNDDIPLLRDLADEHRAVRLARLDLKRAVLNIQNVIDQHKLLFILRQISPSLFLVLMGDQHAIPTHDKAVALSLDLQRGNDLLDLIHHHIHGDDVFSVGEHPADGDDHVARLGVYIGRDDGGLASGFERLQIPVSPGRVIVFRRHPGKSVEVFSHHIAVYPVNVHVKLVFLVLRFHRDIVQDILGRGSMTDHVIDGIRRDPQCAF